MRKVAEVAQVSAVRGQSLFEVIVALTVVSFIMVGLIQVATLSIRNSTFSKSKSQANGYASQLTEWLRGERDTSWITFESRGATETWCFNSLSLGWTNKGVCQTNEVIPGTIFRRQATLTCYQAGAVVLCDGVGVNTDTVNVDIKIIWTDGQGDHSVDVTTQLTNSKSK